MAELLRLGAASGFVAGVNNTATVVRGKVQWQVKARSVQVHQDLQLARATESLSLATSTSSMSQGLEPEEFDRLRSLGIPLKIPHNPPSQQVPSEQREVGGEAPLDLFKPLPRRVTPSLIVREKSKALSASNGSNTILRETRKKRQFERMLQASERDMASATEKEIPPQKQWPFWRKKRDPDGLNARNLTRRITELKRRKQLGQILSLLEEAKAKGKKPNTITMNASMSACVHCGDIEAALDLFDEMTAVGGCGADSITYGTLLKGLGNARRLDDAFELLENMEAGTAPGRPELTEVHLNTLVNACANSGDARRARGVLQRFRAFGRGLGPSALTYNLLIKGYARSDNPLEALAVVEEMQLQGLPLERVSYNSLILACIRGGDLDRALDLLQEMKAEAWRQCDAALWPDIVSYTTLFKGLAEDGDLDGVLSLVREMKAGPRSLESSSPEGVSRAQFLEAVKEAHRLDRVAYGAVIDACLAVGSTADALVFLREMEELAEADLSMKPRAHVFLSLMRGLASKGEVEEARELRGRLLSGKVGGRVWPEVLWEADELVLEAAVVAGKVSEAEAHFLAMVSRASSSNPSSFSPRGIEAVVRLAVASKVPAQELKPVALGPGVAPRSAVELVMRCAAAVPTLTANCSREDLERALAAGPEAVPVLDDTQQCLGLLTKEHLAAWGEICDAKSGQLKASSLTAPPEVSRFAPVGDAAALMVSKKAKVLAVVQGDLRYQRGLAREGPRHSSDRTVVGFLFYEMLF